MDENQNLDPEQENTTSIPVPDEQTQWGLIRTTPIIEEMERSYLDYAMSVIVARALPDVRDGLKPVHRRILFAMKEMGLTHKSAYKKSARIVGEVLGKYHPHGDQAVYQTMVRLAQTFSMRYPLIDGQGNFGSIDGDSAAAMRYTEARLSKIAGEALEDIDKRTVDLIDNFDGSQQEPTVLPAKLPNLLLMGSDGIAVGMATKIPPHNLLEVVDAIKALIDKSTATVTKHYPDEELVSAPYRDLIGNLESGVEIEELCKHIKGPDFPTAGIIYDTNEIKKLYATGKASIIVRGVAEIVEKKSGRFQILITELPYQVNKAKLITNIAELVKKKRLEGIADLRDESDRKGMTVAVDLKKDAKPKSVLNNLYKFTELQTSFPANVVALTSDGTPHLLNLKQILMEYTAHRQGVIVRRSQFELKTAQDRAHILEGLLIALKNIDDVIETIKKSPDSETAKTNLMSKFGLSEIQSIAILDMQLRKLAALERQKIEAEYQELKKQIEKLVSILKDPKQVLQIIKDEITKLALDYPEKRKTKIVANAPGTFSEEDLIPAEETIVALTKSGYIKRMPLATFKTQKRGGKGVSGMTIKDTDEIHLLTNANTHDRLLVFSSKGKVFSLKVWELPEGSRISKGQAIINLINIDTDETIQSILPLTSQINKNDALFFTTKKGTVKRTVLSKYENIKSNGLIAIKLTDGDSLVWVNKTSGNDHILLVSRDGKSIRFKENDVRPTDRDTMGVRGILLKGDDFIISMESFTEAEPVSTDKRVKLFRDLLVVTEKGMGKRTPLPEYPIQNRSGQGLKVSETADKTGKIAGALLVDQDSEVVLITTSQGQAIKLPVRNIPRLGRATQGVILMRFAKEGDSIVAVTVISESEEE
ncbi:TPA: DNA gyrase subunit A [Candidatus Collierbacteria bacterium]|uniref:DNA gyrase subunit A n=1 Tax=Candidatus Collierbacteria bacterium GW2011_GWB2_44_22 TaxID=1618387 RepID=A0A0G1HY00_9BACT|nr:MAG: gyrase subunit A protein [Candidatus Collierbacteria bacterium GW2011_GWA2_44_13]KKT51526.1 MAG: gyrase subunit A protein [Candidatus Collierbacteria bacterium GW2011_GWB1_44_197]KKT52021.1 MAG: gyrase subunit A protein [Candidatus Collierbacteria bacterium GW2011_GWB2_44_22]KKT62121.1 MAG: gyrase subunit A protein [Candidatus Collierbacteria bacterium GW2011_GWD1_44_27]KKT66691.1 MAG: gyrase subunit A protein [Candidatus Collierbacteria bacterium GW2011_GWC2_44_30]KKT69382.1 MAG: gyra